MCCTACESCRELAQLELATQVSLLPTRQRIIFSSPMQSTPCSHLLWTQLIPLPCNRNKFWSANGLIAAVWFPDLQPLAIPGPWLHSAGLCCLAQSY